MLQTVALICTLALLSGCASLQNPVETQKFQIETLWTRSLTDLNKGYRRSHRMQPVLTDQYVIQGNGFNGITAFDRKNGNQLWHFNIKNGVEGGAQVSSNTVFFGGNDSYFYALDLTTGKEKWKFETQAQILAPPVVKNGFVYFLSGNNTLFALDSRTGKQKWLYRRAQTTNLTVRGGATPVLLNGRLYIGMSDGYLVALDASDGGLIWERALSQKGRFIDVDSTPVIFEQKIYVSSYDGSLFCLSLGDGQILWQFNEGGFSPPLIQNEQVYYATSLGKIYSLQPNTGQILWDVVLEKGNVATELQYHRGFLIYGESRGELKFISARSGEERLKFSPGRGIAAAPVVSQKGEIFFISNQGYLYALQLDRVTKKESYWR